MTDKLPLREENGSFNTKENDKEDETKNEKPEDFLMGLGSWRPDWLQEFNTVKCFLVVLCVASITQGVVVNGLSVISIPTIEKEFGIPSKSAGIIVSGNDVGALLFVGPISFLGSKSHKPKWIAVGMIVTGIGGFLFALPKLLIPAYQPIGRSSFTFDTCSLNNTLSTEECTRNESPLHVSIMFIAQIIMGAGVLPLLTLGPAFLDENVTPKASPMYIGINFGATMLGPGLGYMCGGFFLRVFTNFKKPEGMNIDMSDPRWIGAWWLGFVTLSGLFFVTAFVLLLYPKQIKGGREKRLKAIAEGHMPSSDTSVEYTIKGYFRALIQLCLNKIYILSVLSLTIKLIYTIGLTSFFVKVLVVKFGVPAYKSSMIFGSLMVPAMLFGVLAGSYIMRKIKIHLTATSAAKICLLVALITLPSSFFFLIEGCKNTNMAGLAVPYDNNTKIGSLSAKCNSNCKCSEYSYQPICGSNGITYKSPCFAGCDVSFFNEKKQPVFGNCSCMPSMEASNSQKNIMQDMKSKSKTEKISKFEKMRLLSSNLYNKATFGVCDRGCKNFILFLAISAPNLLISFIGSVPHRMLVLRSVPDNQRSFALGIQFLVMRGLSFLPGPIIMGAVVDSQCTVWMYDKCGNKKNCADYDIDKLSRNIVVFSLVVSGISTLIYVGIVLIQRFQKTETKGAPEEALVL